MNNDITIRPSDIAIVGWACRFPGAENVAEFWQNLRLGRESIRHFDQDELEQTEPALRNHPRYVKAGAILPDIDRFDAEFFGYSAREAALMDPQQRIFLECAWEALEHAGYAPGTHRARVGVYAGASMSNYFVNNVIETYPYTGTNLAEFQAVLANDRNYLATRVSYKLNLTGPSVNVQAACSTGLLTVHLACQGLWLGECDLALAGGVSLKVPQKSGYLYEEGMIHSPDGHCRVFDADAGGTLFGNGAGIVVVKLLQDAVRDGDTILAVIKGSAVNNDGAHKAGFTAPSSAGQTQVIREALALAEVDPATIGYVEAHGTGTRLGDPIEIAALTEAYTQQSVHASLPPRSCAIGSVKTNIGHLEEAAGIAGLIKVALALHHGELPPSLHFAHPNPDIDFARGPFYVNTALTPWPRTDSPRRAAVSSFGMGGTNCHIVLEETVLEETLPEETVPEEAPLAQAADGAPPERTWHLLPLSARNDAALHALARRWDAFLQTQPEAALPDIAYTARNHRRHFDQRLSTSGTSIAQIRSQLAAYVDGRTRDGARRGAAPPQHDAPRVAFLFSGQGSQYPNMGRDLYATQAPFRTALNRCADLLASALDRPLLSVLFPDDGDANEQSSAINQTVYTQPALFALEYALAALWRSWGVHPHVVMGHSVGEITAACVAGLFSLEDALMLVAARARLMQTLPEVGMMVAVHADEQRLRALVAPHAADVAIAAVNGPEDVVLSGRRDRIDPMVELLTAAGIRTQTLAVSHAFHSPLMEPMLDEFRRVAERIRYHPPTVPLVSNVTGRLATDEIASADYWVRHVRATVRFADGLATLQQHEIDALLEIGPQPVLLGMAERAGRTTARSIPSLRRGRADGAQLLESLGELYMQGVSVDWRGFDRDEPRRKVFIPTYPFQRQRYWLENAPSGRRSVAALHPLIETRTFVPLHQETIFETACSVRTWPFLADHRVYGEIVAPGASYLAMVCAAAGLSLGAAPYELHDVIFPEALTLPPDASRTLQTVFQPSAASGPEGRAFRVISFDADGVVDGVQAQSATHAVGRVTRWTGTPPAPWITPVALQERMAQQAGAQSLDVAAFYAQDASAMAFGPTFRWITALYCLPSRPATHTAEAWAKLSLPVGVDDLRAHAIHPGLLDACFQVASAACAQRDDAGELALPFAIAALRLYSAPSGREWWCYSRQVDERRWDMQLYGSQGQLIAEIEGYETRVASRERLQRTPIETAWLYAPAWTLAPEAVDSSAPGAEPDRPAAWLILGEVAEQTGELSEQLVTALQADGPPTIFTTMGDGLTLDAVDEFAVDFRATVDPADPAAFAHLLDALHQRHLLAPNDALGVIALWGAEPGQMTQSPLERTLQICNGLLHLVQALAQSSHDARLWLVTRGSQTVHPHPLQNGPWTSAADAMALGATGGAVWSLGRAIEQELPRLRCTLIDLDANPDALAISHLRHEVQSGWRTPREIAYRRGLRYVGALRRWQLPQVWETDPPHRMQLSAYGSTDSVGWVPHGRTTPGAGEVEIAVKAAGLNLRDVLNALGLLRDYYATTLGIERAADVPLGFECAGVVTAVGPDVTAVAVGDRVMALADGSFASHVTAPVAATAPIPTQMSFVEAATLPLAFLTAWYGLITRAQLQPRERVLIHAAAGGVGQAAVQIARLVGAEVYATASRGKWRFLQAQGVAHLYDSRAMDFAAQIQQQTEGAGVHVVLNSLAGDTIESSFEALGEGGRFVELGKRGIWSPADVQARRPDVHYEPFDLGEVFAQDPALQTHLWQVLSAQLNSGALRPLPHTVFPVAKSAEAFRYMQQARHVGKVVLSFEPPPQTSLRTDATYLITGGLGALGLQVARQLAEEGAGHLVLSSRRAAMDDETKHALAALESNGAHVHVMAADVAEWAEVQALVARCQAIAPLRGVVHAAGVLDDGVLMQQSGERFAAVMRPKVAGSWHLHRATIDLPLDFFVCFSSAASLLGASGQSNYAAANGFMDALMQQRQRHGLPGLSVNWGAWADVGMAARMRQDGHGMELPTLSPQQGRRFFHKLLRQPAAQVAVLPDAVDTVAQDRQGIPAADAIMRQSLRAISDPEEQQEMLGEYVRAELAAVLGMPSGDLINPRAPLFDLGLDSLMAVELNSKLEAGLGCPLPTTLLLNYPTLEVLMPQLLQHVLGAPQ